MDQDRCHNLGSVHQNGSWVGRAAPEAAAILGVASVVAVAATVAVVAVAATVAVVAAATVAVVEGEIGRAHV